MSEILEKEYYKENPQYSSVECLKCKEKIMKVIGIVSSEEYDIPDKTLHKCDKCGQEAYIEVEWLFTIYLKKQN